MDYIKLFKAIIIASGITFLITIFILCLCYKPVAVFTFIIVLTLIIMFVTMIYFIYNEIL